MAGYRKFITSFNENDLQDQLLRTLIREQTGAVVGNTWGALIKVDIYPFAADIKSRSPNQILVGGKRWMNPEYKVL